MPNFSVINLISYVGINSVFIIITLELKIISTKTDMVSREQRFCEKRGRLKVCKINCA